MGVQESQNCTVITMRMKHRRMRWSDLSCTNERNCRDIKCSNKRIQENIPRRVYKMIKKNLVWDDGAVKNVRY